MVWHYLAELKLVGFAELGIYNELQGTIFLVSKICKFLLLL